MSANETPQGSQNPQVAYSQQFAGQNGAVPVSPAAPAKKKGGCFKWGAIAGGVILGAAVLASLNGGVDSTSGQSASSATDSSIAADAAMSGEAVAESVTEENQQEQVPVEYRNALRKAKSYSDTMHMSKAGIYEQLTSEYGEKFSVDAAQYAVDNLEADWNQNALEKARTYQDSMAMSPDAIYDQLTSEYGENFTAEEAQYAVDNL